MIFFIQVHVAPGCERSCGQELHRLEPNYAVQIKVLQVSEVSELANELMVCWCEAWFVLRGPFLSFV